MRRSNALHIRDELGIEAELQDRAALGFVRKLRVDHFVGPRAEGRRLIDPAQNICPPGPVAGAERALNNDLSAFSHSVARPHDRFIADAIAIDDCDSKAAGSQVLDVALLVASPTLQKGLEKWVIRDLRSSKPAICNCDVQAGQMTAVQIPDEV
jgi:hypothetical protein